MSVARMRKRKRDFGALLAATAGFIAGVFTLQTGHASWFGIVGIDGRQARLFGWASIIFSIVIFFVYLRGGKGNGTD